MFNIPEINTPELEAFFVGFVIPFISATCGFAIGIVIQMIKKIDK